MKNIILLLLLLCLSSAYANTIVSSTYSKSLGVGQKFDPLSEVEIDPFFFDKKIKKIAFYVQKIESSSSVSSIKTTVHIGDSKQIVIVESVADNYARFYIESRPNLVLDLKAQNLRLNDLKNLNFAIDFDQKSYIYSMEVTLEMDLLHLDLRSNLFNRLAQNVAKNIDFNLYTTYEDDFRKSMITRIQALKDSIQYPDEDVIVKLQEVWAYMERHDTDFAFLEIVQKTYPKLLKNFVEHLGEAKASELFLELHQISPLKEQYDIISKIFTEFKTAQGLLFAFYQSPLMRDNETYNSEGHTASAQLFFNYLEKPGIEQAVAKYGAQIAKDGMNVFNHGNDTFLRACRLFEKHEFLPVINAFLEVIAEIENIDSTCINVAFNLLRKYDIKEKVQVYHQDYYEIVRGLTEGLWMMIPQRHIFAIYVLGEIRDQKSIALLEQVRKSLDRSPFSRNYIAHIDEALK